MGMNGSGRRTSRSRDIGDAQSVRFVNDIARCLPTPVRRRSFRSQRRDPRVESTDSEIADRADELIRLRWWDQLVSSKMASTSTDPVERGETHADRAACPAGVAEHLDHRSTESVDHLRRTREIGIRAALGARPGRIVAGIFSRAFLQIGAGVLVGSGLAALLGLGAMREVLLLLAAVGVMLVVGITACAVPLRRALRIEPTEALRLEGWATMNARAPDVTGTT